jgi:hypothetical protein
VIKGHFTPSLFSPAWIFDQKLIGGEELHAANVQVIAREVAIFSVGWLNVHVTSDTLQLSTLDIDEFERVRDAASGLLRTLTQSPIGALGINRESHFRIDSPDRWHAIGDALTPKKIWEDHLLLPGMRSVAVTGARPDRWQGRVTVQVEPSMRVPQGVFVAYNDHFMLQEATSKSSDRAGWVLDEPVEASLEKIPPALEILSKYWTDSLRRAQEIIEMVSEVGK